MMDYTTSYLAGLACNIFIELCVSRRFKAMVAGVPLRLLG